MLSNFLPSYVRPSSPPLPPFLRFYTTPALCQVVVIFNRRSLPTPLSLILLILLLILNCLQLLSLQDQDQNQLVGISLIEELHSLTLN